MSSSIFDGLNPSQKDVVQTFDGPILVVAGPGSGKTTTLTRRVAHMIEQNIDPKKILLLTFTRAAAQNMIARASILKEDAKHVTSGTFHSIALLLLRKFGKSVGLSDNFTILDPEDTKDFLKVLLEETPFPNENLKIKPATVQEILSFHYNTQKKISDILKKSYPEYEDQYKWFETIKDTYQTRKKEKSLVDYDDLLLYFAVFANTDPYSKILSDSWNYVMVDEYQDCNALQLDILYGLGKIHKNIMVVGDPGQSIYAFRGSAPDTMIDFSHHWTDTKTIFLDINYRSTQSILNSVNDIEATMAKRFDRSLKPSDPNNIGIKPVLTVLESEFDQGEKIVTQIKELYDKGVSYNRQAILTRSVHSIRLIEGKIREAGIPYILLGGIKIDQASHVKDLLSLIRITENIYHDPAWIRILQTLEGIGAKTASNLHSDAVQKIESGQDLISALKSLKWPKKTDPNPLYESLSCLLDNNFQPKDRILKAISKYEPIFKEKYDNYKEKRKDDLTTLAILAQKHKTLKSFLSAITLDYSLDKKEDDQAIKQESPLVISTIHSAKGLEWHTVYIPNLTKGAYPSPYAGSQEDLEEEKRIFYVAISRAEKNLFLYKYQTDKGGNILEDSPYEKILKKSIEIKTEYTPKKEKISWTGTKSNNALEDFLKKYR